MIYYSDKTVFGSNDNSYTLQFNIFIFRVCNLFFFFFFAKWRFIEHFFTFHSMQISIHYLSL